jgi:hypothetical protein
MLEWDDIISCNGVNRRKRSRSDELFDVADLIDSSITKPGGLWGLYLFAAHSHDNCSWSIIDKSSQYHQTYCSFVSSSDHAKTPSASPCRDAPYGAVSSMQPPGPGLARGKRFGCSPHKETATNTEFQTRLERLWFGTGRKGGLRFRPRAGWLQHAPAQSSRLFEWPHAVSR